MGLTHTKVQTTSNQSTLNRKRWCCIAPQNNFHPKTWNKVGYQFDETLRSLNKLKNVRNVI